MPDDDFQDNNSHRASQKQFWLVEKQKPRNPGHSLPKLTQPLSENSLLAKMCFAFAVLLLCFCFRNLLSALLLSAASH